MTLTGFRSYRSIEWRPDPGINLLIGANGAGKTNLLEAIAFLATLRSLRSAPEESMVEYAADAAVIRAEVESTSDHVRSLLEVELGGGRSRRVQVNRNRLARSTDLLGHIRVVTFLPEDLDLVKRGPGYRRDLLDEIAVSHAPVAHLEQAELDRALRQRNAFLRQGGSDPVTLSVWDERVSLAAGKVMSRRARAAGELESVLVESYGLIAGQATAVGWEYRSGWGGELDPTISAAGFADRHLEALGRLRRVDIDRRVTTVGPHRDDPALLLDGHDLRYHGSQGEQRSMALALRLATHKTVSERVGTPPILLLDDVFSELDPDRSSALAAALPAGQTLITTADRADVPLDGIIWTVADHSVQPRAIRVDEIRRGDGATS